MTISCDHPRPKLNLPGYSPPRYSWQPPTFLPQTSLADLSRALTDQFRSVYAVLQQLGQRRAVVPLYEDIDARAGQVIVGVADGQVIRLPLGLEGDLGQIGIVLTDVISPVTIVNPDGTTQTLGTAGAYDFVNGLTDSYQTNPGGTVLGGSIPTDRLLGRDTAGTGAFETISVTGGLEFTGSQSIRIADLGVTTAKIAASAVTNAKLANVTAGTVKGMQVDGSTAAPVDLTGQEVGELLRRETVVTDSTSSGSIATYTIANITTQVQFKLTGSATIHGMTASSATFGKTVEFSFDSGFAGEVTFKNESASAGSTLARVRTPGGVDFTLRAGETCIATYFDSRWRIVGIGKPVSRLFPGAPIYDVMDSPFNAAGDGVTDDTSAINAAIAAANAVPGAIYLGSRHRITAPLTTIAANNVGLIGRGNFTGGTILLADPVSAGLGVVSFGAGRDCFARDFWLAIQTASADGWGIRLEGATRATLNRILITGAANGVDVDRSNTTFLRRIIVDDIFGGRGFYFHGSGGSFNHVTRAEECFAGSAYPLGDGPGKTWATSTAYSVGDLVSVNGLIWQCSTAGTSAAAGTGPAGLPSTNLSLVHVTPVVDGTAQWRLAHGAFVGYDHGSFCHTVILRECGGARGLHGLRLFDDLGSAPTFFHAWQQTSEDTLSHGIFIDACDGAVMLDQVLALPVMTSGDSGVRIGSSATRWQFNDGESLSGVSIAGTAGILRGMHTASIDLATTVREVLVENCHFTGNVTVAAGADEYGIVGNFIGGTLTNTPGIASTRVVRSNVPSTEFTLTDGDKGHIVVSSSGTVWLWDTTVAITGAQVISTTTDLTLTVGDDFFCTAQADVVINAGDTAGGVAIHAGLTPKTGANNDRVTISADDQVVIEPTGSFRVFTNAVERLEIESDGAWQLAGNTGTSGQVLTSGGASAGPSWTTIATLTDGDKGDVTVSSSGATWTVDTNIAKAWTGVHSFTSSTFTATMTGDISLTSSAGSVVATGLGDSTFGSSSGGTCLGAGAAGHLVTNIGNGDVIINATSGIAINADATTPVTGASTGAVEVFGTTFSVTTNGVERLEIESDGAWQLAGDQGTSNDIMMSRGASAPPIWASPAEVVDAIEGETPIWTDVHRFDSYVQWGNNTGLPIAGDLRKGSGSIFDIRGGNGIELCGNGGVVISGATPSNAGTLIITEGASTNSQLTSVPITGATNPELTMGNHVGTEPVNNVCRAVHSSFSSTITNATTTVTLFPSTTIPSGSWRVGRTYTGVAHVVVSRGATLTASSLRSICGLSGGFTDTVDVAIPTLTDTYTYRLEYMLTCLSVGASGSFMQSLRVSGGSGGVASMGGSVDLSPHTVDTTASQTISATVNMTVAVANLSMTRTTGYIIRTF